MTNVKLFRATSELLTLLVSTTHREAAAGNTGFGLEASRPDFRTVFLSCLRASTPRCELVWAVKCNDETENRSEEIQDEEDLPSLAPRSSPE